MFVTVRVDVCELHETQFFAPPSPSLPQEETQMSIYRRHRVLRSLYLDALYIKGDSFLLNKSRSQAQETAGDRASNSPLLAWLRARPPA